MEALKKLKDLLGVLLFKANTIVSKTNVVSWLAAQELRGIPGQDFAFNQYVWWDAGFGKFEGVADQVLQDLPELHWVNFYLAQITGFNYCIFFFDGFIKVITYFIYNDVEVGQFKFSF
jgi:hypothetical protein